MAEKKRTNVFGADWTCPKCGFTNPEAVDECQHCKFMDAAPPIPQEPPKNPWKFIANALPHNVIEATRHDEWRNGADAMSAYFRPLLEQAEQRVKELEEKNKKLEDKYTVSHALYKAIVKQAEEGFKELDNGQFVTLEALESQFKPVKDAQ